MSVKDENKKQLSIIIPVSNDLRIGKCLQSLIDGYNEHNPKNNKDKDYEVIVIANNANEKVMGLIEPYTNKLPLKIIESDKKRIGHLRNLGIESSNSNAFYFIDSDCEMKSLSLEKAIDSSLNNEVVRGKIIFLGSGKLSLLDAKLRQKRYEGDKTFAYCPNLIVDKKVFEKHGLFNENFEYGSDGEFARRIRKERVNVTYDENIEIFHHGPTKDQKVIQTWVKYGEGRQKRYENANFTEKVKGLFLPNLFDLKENMDYNLVVFANLLCRWYGWGKTSLPNINEIYRGQ